MYNIILFILPDRWSFFFWFIHSVSFFYIKRKGFICHREADYGDPGCDVSADGGFAEAGGAAAGQNGDPGGRGFGGADRGVCAFDETEDPDCPFCDRSGSCRPRVGGAWFYRPEAL